MDGLSFFARLPIARIDNPGYGLVLIARDGTRLRLSGIEVLRPRQAQALLEPRLRAPISVYVDHHIEDRYGDIWGYIQTEDGVGLQELLLTQGLAVAWPQQGRDTCLSAYLATEAKARTSKRGLWAQDLLDAQDTKALGALPWGQPVVIEGTLLSVGKTRSGSYLNFGTDYSSDTSAYVARKHLPALIAAGKEPAALTGKLLRLRGYVDHRSGPAFAVEHPAQIELLPD